MMKLNLIFVFLLLLRTVTTCKAFHLLPNYHYYPAFHSTKSLKVKQQLPLSSSSRPQMAQDGDGRSWIDNLIPEFLKSRQGDFVKLDDTENSYGPGPLLVLYNAPSSIDDDEYMDMITDGLSSSSSSSKTVKLYRTNNNDNNIIDLSMKDALEMIMKKDITTSINDDYSKKSVNNVNVDDGTVLLFSGFTNTEMMTIYNIIGQEIYTESGGQINPACAKAVPNAMEKPLRQVLSEIAGDHQEATNMMESE